MALLQQVLYLDPINLGYTEEGHCRGVSHPNLPGPQRFQWEISAEVRVGYQRTLAVLENGEAIQPVEKCD